MILATFTVSKSGGEALFFIFVVVFAAILIGPKIKKWKHVNTAHYNEPAGKLYSINSKIFTEFFGYYKEDPRYREVTIKFDDDFEYVAYTQYTSIWDFGMIRQRCLLNCSADPLKEWEMAAIEKHADFGRKLRPNEGLPSWKVRETESGT
jgi:hypothetical protein